MGKVDKYISTLKNSENFEKETRLKLIGYVVDNYKVTEYAYDCEFSREEIYYILERMIYNEDLKGIDLFTSIYDNYEVLCLNEELRDMIDGILIMRKFKDS